MGCQKEIARQIIDQGGDYVLALKENQPALHEDVSLFFADVRALGGAGIGHGYHQEVDGGHGRVEIRRCFTVGGDRLAAGAASGLEQAGIDRDGGSGSAGVRAEEHGGALLH